ncbi:hypothetical protein D3C74_172960 [compost metagenome]
MIYLHVHDRGKKVKKLQTKKDYIRDLLSLLSYAHTKGKQDIREFSRSDMELFQTYLEQRYAKSNTLATLPMPKTVITDAGYESEENYLYALGEEKDL